MKNYTLFSSKMVFIFCCMIYWRKLVLTLSQWHDSCFKVSFRYTCLDTVMWYFRMVNQHLVSTCVYFAVSIDTRATNRAFIFNVHPDQ